MVTVIVTAYNLLSEKSSGRVSAFLARKASQMVKGMNSTSSLPF